MNIPNDGGWGKPEPERTQQYGHVARHFTSISRDWAFWVCLALTGSLFLGIGLVAARQNSSPKDPLWIEQLPASELSGSIGTSTPAGQGSEVEAAQVPTQGSAQRVQATAPPQPAAAAAAFTKTGTYVASKTGTKYYLPSCATAKRIKDANKVWFATKAAAEAAGYQPAANCKGL